MAKKARRTRTAAYRKKLYAVRDSKVGFMDIQTYKRATIARISSAKARRRQ